MRNVMIPNHLLHKVEISVIEYRTIPFYYLQFKDQGNFIIKFTTFNDQFASSQTKIKSLKNIPLLRAKLMTMTIPNHTLVT